MPVLRAIEAEINRDIKWLKERDPEKKCERMQGAKYAYQQVIKKLRKH